MPARARAALYGFSGRLLFLALWQIAGKSGVGGVTLHALSDVLHIYTVPWRRAVLLRAALATLSSAGIGLLAGTVLGYATVLATHLLPPLCPGLNRMAVVVNALPAIALGPILILTAGRESAPALLAAIPVFFLVYIAATSGFRAADRRLGQLLLATSTPFLPCPPCLMALSSPSPPPSWAPSSASGSARPPASASACASA